MTERNFTKGPILPAMLRFALPTLAALLLQGIGTALLIRFPVSWLFSTLPGANLFLPGLATPITTAVVSACYVIMKRQMQQKLQHISAD